MDLQKVTDIKELKAMAFDTLQTIEVQQNNLRLIQQRIAELEQQTAKKK
jgi:uncharacterized coiled-coil protein SlyX